LADVEEFAVEFKALELLPALFARTKKTQNSVLWLIDNSLCSVFFLLAISKTCFRLVEIHNTFKFETRHVSASLMPSSVE